jgi:hypothetical protein
VCSILLEEYTERVSDIHRDRVTEFRQVVTSSDLSYLEIFRLVTVTSCHYWPQLCHKGTTSVSDILCELYFT